MMTVAASRKIRRRRLLAVAIILLSFAGVTAIIHLLLIQPARANHDLLDAFARQQGAQVAAGLKDQATLLDIAAAANVVTSTDGGYVITSTLQQLNLKTFTLRVTGADGYTWQYGSANRKTVVNCDLGCTLGIAS